MRKTRVATALIVLLACVFAGTAGPAAAADGTVTPLAWVSVDPEPELIVDPIKGDQVRWVDACTINRFCTFQAGNTKPPYSYIGFQFYRCQEYALTNWGINGPAWVPVFNNQNVTVKYLNSRHAEIDSTPPFTRELVNFKPVWFIDLCN